MNLFIEHVVFNADCVGEANVVSIYMQIPNSDVERESNCNQQSPFTIISFLFFSLSLKSVDCDEQ